MKVIHKLMMCLSIIVFTIFFNVVLAGTIQETPDVSPENGKTFGKVCSEEKLTQECKDACLNKELKPCLYDSNSCLCEKVQKFKVNGIEKDHVTFVQINIEKSNSTESKDLITETDINNQPSSLNSKRINNNNNEEIKEEETQTKTVKTVTNKTQETENSEKVDQHITNHNSDNSETALIVYTPPIVQSKSNGHNDPVQSVIKSEYVTPNSNNSSQTDNSDYNGKIWSIQNTSIVNKKINEKSSEINSKLELSKNDSSIKATVSIPNDGAQNVENNKTSTYVKNESIKSKENPDEDLQQEDSEKIKRPIVTEKQTQKFVLDKLRFKQKQDSSESESEETINSSLLRKNEDNELLSTFDKPDVDSDTNTPNVVEKHITSNSQLRSLISNQAFIMSAVLVYIILCMVFLYLRTYRKRSYTRVPLLNNFDEANEL